jgi:sugar lactone lactonase YvrE
MDGKYLDEYPGFNAYNLFMSADNHLWVVDWLSHRIFKLDLDGHLEYTFGQEGTDPGYTLQVHQMSADEEGNLYLAEAGGGRTQKFRPKPGADPTKIVWGRPMVPKGGTARSSN